MLINLSPQPVVGQLNCLADDFFGACYDSDLDFEVGDVLTWVVVKHLVDDIQEDYGVDSDEPLRINYKIIQDFRGINATEVLNNWDTYFYTNRTVAGELIEGGSIYEGENYWIRPTLYILNNTDRTIVNLFKNMYEVSYSEPYLETSKWIYNLIYYNNLQNGLWISSYEEISTSIADPSIHAREFHETKTNINTGIIEEITDIFEYFNLPNLTNWHSIIRFDKQQYSLKLSANLPLIGGIVIGLLVLSVISILIIRKFK